MSQSKRHHIVPQMILRNFLNSNGKLYCFNKDTGKRFETSPANVFVESNLYTRKLADGYKDTSVETKIATEIEAHAAPVILKIIERAREQRSLELAKEEVSAWLRFLRFQHDRMSTTLKKIQEKNYSDSIIREFELKYRPLTPDEREEWSNKETKDRASREAWLDNLLYDNYDDLPTMRMFKSKGIGATVTGKSNKSFVIGSNPVIVKPNKAGSTSLMDPGVGQLYPVAHDVIIHWGRMPGNPELVILTDYNIIRALNEQSLEQSTLIAGRSRDLIKSLSRSMRGRKQV